MRQFIFFAALCCTFLVSVCYADDKRLIVEQENVAKQMEDSRAAAHKAANAWESHIEKLNAEVLPEDHFSHNPAKVSKVIKKHAAHRATVKSSVQHVKPQAKAPVQHKAAVQAAAYLKHLDHLSEETLPHMNKASAKWHTESAAQVILNLSPRSRTFAAFGVLFQPFCCGHFGKATSDVLISFSLYCSFWLMTERLRLKPIPRKTRLRCQLSMIQPRLCMHAAKPRLMRRSPHLGLIQQQRNLRCHPK